MNRPGFLAPPDNPGQHEHWVRKVYRFFQNCYSPDSRDRNASHAIIPQPFNCACGQGFRTADGLGAHLARHTPLFTAFGISVPDPGHGKVTPPLPPPEHHLGFLHVRSYWPDHEPRTDLITDPSFDWASQTVTGPGISG